VIRPRADTASHERSNALELAIVDSR